jgi:hypothetical protein
MKRQIIITTSCLMAIFIASCSRKNKTQSADSSVSSPSAAAKPKASNQKMEEILEYQQKFLEQLKIAEDQRKRVEKMLAEMYKWKRPETFKEVL